MSRHRTPRSSATLPVHFMRPAVAFTVPRAQLKVTARHFNLQWRTVVLAPSSLSRAHAALKTVRESREGAARSFPLAIRANVFAADYGFVTLTMDISSLAAGILSGRLGPTTATVAVASLAIGWVVFWGAWAWKLWR
jgi:hypothetical protein